MSLLFVKTDQISASHALYLQSHKTIYINSAIFQLKFIWC